MWKPEDWCISACLNTQKAESSRLQTIRSNCLILSSVCCQWHFTAHLIVTHKHRPVSSVCGLNTLCCLCFQYLLFSLEGFFFSSSPYSQRFCLFNSTRIRVTLLLLLKCGSVSVFQLFPKLLDEVKNIVPQQIWAWNNKTSRYIKIPPVLWPVKLSSFADFSNNIQSCPKVLEWHRQFICVCYALITFGFMVVFFFFISHIKQHKAFFIRWLKLLVNKSPGAGFWSK